MYPLHYTFTANSQKDHVEGVELNADKLRTLAHDEQASFGIQLESREALLGAR